MAVSAEEEAQFLSEVDVLEPLSREELDELSRRLPDTSLESQRSSSTSRRSAVRNFSCSRRDECGCTGQARKGRSLR